MMKNLLHSLIVVACLTVMGGSYAYAQKLQASRHHYSTDDGLASNAIAQIVQDDYGYICHDSMWVSALYTGDNGYDGIQNKAHKQDHAGLVFLLSDGLFHLKVHKLSYVVAEFLSEVVN
jgi:hypothetical protein